MPAPKPATAEGYIASWPPNVQRQLRDLQGAILKAVPTAVPSISYGVLAYKVEGKYVVYAGAAAKHVTLHAMGDRVMREHPEWFAGHKLGKGSIQVPHDEPVPTALVVKIVKARRKNMLADLAAKAHEGPKATGATTRTRKPTRTTKRTQPTKPPAALARKAPSRSKKAA